MNLVRMWHGRSHWGVCAVPFRGAPVVAQPRADTGVEAVAEAGRLQRQLLPNLHKVHVADAHGARPWMPVHNNPLRVRLETQSHRP